MGLRDMPPPKPRRKVTKLIFDGWCPYKKSDFTSSSSFCRDIPATGVFHSGQTCFRRLGPSGSGMHICFDDKGGCDIHFDSVPPCTKRNKDGSCDFFSCFGGPGFKHFMVDVGGTTTMEICIPKPKDCCPGQQ